MLKRNYLTLYLGEGLNRLCIYPIHLSIEKNMFRLKKKMASVIHIIKDIHQSVFRQTCFFLHYYGIFICKKLCSSVI